MGFNSAFKGLMLYREIMAVCSEIHTKHINTLCGQNVELLDVKLSVHIVTMASHSLPLNAINNSLRRSKQGASLLSQQLGYADNIAT